MLSFPGTRLPPLRRAPSSDKASRQFREIMSSPPAPTSSSLAAPRRPLAVVLVASFWDQSASEVCPGGRPRLVRDLSRHLSKLGFSVRILQKGEVDREITLNHDITVCTVRAPIPAWGDLIFALRTRREVRRAQVCFYATPEDGFPFFAPNGVAIQHGIWWDSPDYSGVWGAVVKGVQLARILMMCRRTRRVLCVDVNLANCLRQMGALGHAAAAKCTYQPNYVDLAQFPVPSRARIEERWQSQKLLFLRRFEPPRGALLFIETCRLLRDQGVTFHAEMVGWGSQFAAVATLIRKHGLEDHVKVARLGLDQVACALDSATISVVPSRWSEGTSLAAIESIAMGVPVVATDVGGLPNVVIPHYNGEVVAPRAEALARGVSVLLRDKSLYLDMAANCLAMRPAFSLSRWTRGIEEVLDSLKLRAPFEGTLATPSAEFDGVVQRE